MARYSRSSYSKSSNRAKTQELWQQLYQKLQQLYQADLYSKILPQQKREVVPGMMREEAG